MCLQVAPKLGTEYSINFVHFHLLYHTSPCFHIYLSHNLFTLDLFVFFVSPLFHNIHVLYGFVQKPRESHPDAKARPGLGAFGLKSAGNFALKGMHSTHLCKETCSIKGQLIALSFERSCCGCTRMLRYFLLVLCTLLVHLLHFACVCRMHLYDDLGLIGASVVRQPGDGACLFHSLSHGLQIPGVNATTLRARIAAWVQVHVSYRCAAAIVVVVRLALLSCLLLFYSFVVRPTSSAMALRAHALSEFFRLFLFLPPSMRNDATQINDNNTLPITR